MSYMMFVYILYSAQIGGFYIGQTNDLSDRLKRHQSGLEEYTSRGQDWRLFWSTVKDTREDAVVLEKKLKNLSRSRLLSLMLKYKDGIAGPDELLLIKQLSGC